jgi:hypothetical protein
MIIGLELQGLAPTLAGLKQVQAAVAAMQKGLASAKAGGVVIQNATINVLTITGGTITINHRGGGGGAPRAPKPIKLPPTFMDKLKTLLLSSRFGSGGLMPLVSKAVDLLGFEAVAAAAGLKMLWGVADGAAESLTKFKDQMVVSGGSGQEVGRLSALGNVAGVFDMAAAARQLSEKIQSGGAAQGMAANHGMFDYGGDAFGPMDKSKNLHKALDFIFTGPQKEAERFARVMGLEAFVKMRDLSQQTRDALMQAADANAAAHGPAATKNAMEFNAQMEMLKMNFDSLTTNLGDSMLPEFSGLLSVFSAVVKAVNDVYLHVKPLIDFTNSLSLSGSYKKLSDAWDQAFPDKSADDTVTKDHTDAMKDHTTAMRGMFGGGDNARKALPGAWQQNGGQSDNWLGSAAGLGSMGT